MPYRSRIGWPKRRWNSTKVSGLSGAEPETYSRIGGGRYSRRFYSFATRWMVNSVALHREWRGPRQPLRLARTLANTALGRAGMLLTVRERQA